MVSTNLRIARFGATKRIEDDNPISHLSLAKSLDGREFFTQEAAMALDLIMDSYLLLNSDRKIVLSNPKADQLLQKIQSATQQTSREEPKSLPDSVVQTCQLLLENSEYLSDHALPPQAMLTVHPGIQMRISLVDTGLGSEPLFLIALEDKSQASIAQATVDQWLYGLTNREKEVWSLRLQDFSYQDIATELYLSVNTVKKHMKTILAKQEEWRLNTFGWMAS